MSSLRSLAGAGSLLLVVVAPLLAGCTPTPATMPVSTPAPSVEPRGGTGIMPGYEDDEVLQFTPLIIGTVDHEVVPVEGSDGLDYVAYELTVLNDSPRAATLTQIETITGDERGEVIETRDEAEVAANTMIAGDASTILGGSSVIPPGRTAIIVLRDAYPPSDGVPPRIVHRLSATFAPATPEDGLLAPVYPDEVAQLGGAVVTSDRSPLVIGPPLAGPNWIAGNGLETQKLNMHSNVVIPVGGRLNAAEEYGIDFMRIDPSIPATYDGDPTRNESYLAFGEPLLAVADATVVSVVSDRPDITPRQLPQLEALSQATGNAVVLDLGDGVYALYAHMQEGSATVEVGDEVKRGDVIGNLGNSGNTSEAHLHFQLQRGPLLTADNVPWVIDRFIASGMTSPDGEQLIDPVEPGERTDEIPIGGSISDFPEL
jgi:hypothetical protein